ncbi:MAG TPA: hypothetical protein VMV71_03145 [Candidatus Paceibacterota bacterium]|nr:hypothetical protein [Candidatus Paceibacterota bacterium]
MRLLSAVKKAFRDAREKLSGHPTIYAIFGAVGIILFWRGIWHLADFAAVFFSNRHDGITVGYFNFFDSLISAVIGFILLLFTGLFVSDFIGSQMISTAIKTEKKIEKVTQETETKEKTEQERIDELEEKLEKATSHLDEHLENIEKKLGGK